jgi:Ala-tRNA(Pro) deacylase
MQKRLEEFLGALGGRYEVLGHPDAVTAQEQAALTHTPGRQWAKAVIVKERDGYVMAVVPARSSVDLDRLKGLIGHGPVRLATVEEIMGALEEAEPGAIPPFGRLWGLPVYADRSLLGEREITMPAGDRRTAIRMRVEEFLRLARPAVGDFAVDETLVRGGTR